VLTERRAQQPITPLRLFASRERVGAYVPRILVVGGMFSMFFLVTQFLQGVSGFSALQSGIAFLPMTVALFGVVRAMPRFAARVGGTTLLIGGLLVALAGMAWLSRITAGSA
jgi:predicted MFS family arabinose efflux permease